MVDFTLKAYGGYLSAIKKSGLPFLRFDEFIGNPHAFASFCLVRHDVDRKPDNALCMAELEKKMGVVATYYFRYKKHTFKPEIIQKIHALGHETGYHYECLSDTKGNMEEALVDFENNLNKFRKLVPIKTCSMHGRPLRPFDNRDLWRIKKNHDYLGGKLGLLGEVYLDVDYTDMAYISDTGRNWTSSRANRRDKVDSNVSANFHSGKQLLEYLSHRAHPKICFQIHPERWSDNRAEWMMQYGKDKAINLAKSIFSLRNK